MRDSRSRAERQKREAARAALDYVTRGSVLGVGSGSTVNHFIDLIGEEIPGAVAAAVASSNETARRLRAIGVEVVDLASVDSLDLYVDGADEFDPELALIKGAGGALTSEKIVAGEADRFVCIVDESKRVDVLGAVPVPVEVIGLARDVVARRLRAFGGMPSVREGFVTDHGNPILDVAGLVIRDPVVQEVQLETIPGVITCGIFARRRADVVLMANDEGVVRFEKGG
jgi:ribose 5-phosphate isomerase A